MPQGERGYCRNKVNIEGRCHILVYGRPSALQIDPIGKEPSFHSWPGVTSICTGMTSSDDWCKH